MDLATLTDIGTVTLLFRQPVVGLQCFRESTWTYVPAQHSKITVNLADTFSHIIGGGLQGFVHRVVAPPRDQWAYDRTDLL
jgi:isopenicillin N synthase-like dioxygenase